MHFNHEVSNQTIMMRQFLFPSYISKGVNSYEGAMSFK